MSKYIDANKMADELSKVPWYKREDEKQAVRMVKEFPAADVVEVVRCKECKHRDGDYCHNNDGFAHAGDFFFVRPDDFCSRGEKPGEEE